MKYLSFSATRMFYAIFNFLMVIGIAESSKVIDSYSQNEIHISDYCPSSKYCKEGSHVLCTTYDPKQEYGPSCNNPRNITVFPAIAKQILDICNALVCRPRAVLYLPMLRETEFSDRMRSKISNGKETGKDGRLLKRGYGIFRLKWDNELATFAQILANQCVLQRDYCRATKKFSDPAQSAGIIQLNFPNWTPIRPTHIPVVDSDGLNPEKILHFVNLLLKSWYSTKIKITDEMIKSYPDYQKNPVGGKMYLDIIQGPMTHMGCGIVGYTNFVYFEQHFKKKGKPGGSNFNVIHLVCNWSISPKVNNSIYQTTRSPNTTPCGCPKGTTEDSDCLCIEADKDGGDGDNNVKPCLNPEDNCEATVVLLPIVTVEDAPPDKLIHEEPETYTIDRFRNGSYVIRKSGIPDSSGHYIQRGTRPQTLINSRSNDISRLNLDSLRANILELENVHEPKFTRKKSKATGKKSSTFMMASKSKSPEAKSDLSIKLNGPRTSHKDVKTIQRIGNDYLKRHSNKLRSNTQEFVSTKYKDIFSAPVFNVQEQDNTDIIANNADEEIIYGNQYPKENGNASANLQYEDNENKLLYLLDNLEQEVKNTGLDGYKKRIFDAKIKKIYDSIVGLPRELKPSHGSPTIYRDTDFLETDRRKITDYTENYYPSNTNMDIIHPDKTYINNYDDFDQKYISESNYIKNLDYRGVSDDKYTNRKNLFDDDPFHRNLEHEYNEHNYDLNKLGRNYHDDEEQTDNEESILTVHHVPVPRSQNNMGKYDKHRYQEDSLEDMKHRRLNKLRDKEAKPTPVSQDIDRDYYKNVEDDRHNDKRSSKRRTISYKHKDSELIDTLSLERRKYYQDKIDNLKRRLKNYRHIKVEQRSNSRYPRKMRPNVEDHNLDRPMSTIQGNSFYVPDRARFLHGF